MLRRLTLLFFTIWIASSSSPVKADSIKGTATRQTFIQAVVAQIDPLFPDDPAAFFDPNVASKILFSQDVLEPFVLENSSAARDAFLAERFHTEFLWALQIVSGSPLSAKTSPLVYLPQGDLKTFLESNLASSLAGIKTDRKKGLADLVTKALEYPLLQKIYLKWAKRRIAQSVSLGTDLLTVKSLLFGEAKLSELDPDVRETWLRVWTDRFILGGAVSGSLPDFDSLKAVFSQNPSPRSNAATDDLVEIWIALHSLALQQNWLDLSNCLSAQKESFVRDLLTNFSDETFAQIKRAIFKNPALLDFLFGVPSVARHEIYLAPWMKRALEVLVDRDSRAFLHTWLFEVLESPMDNGHALYSRLSLEDQELLSKQLRVIASDTKLPLISRLKSVRFAVMINREGFWSPEADIELKKVLSQGLVIQLNNAEKELLTSLFIDFDSRGDPTSTARISEILETGSQGSKAIFFQNCFRLLAGSLANR